MELAKYCKQVHQGINFGNNSRPCTKLFISVNFLGAKGYSNDKDKIPVSQTVSEKGIENKHKYLEIIHSTK